MKSFRITIDESTYIKKFLVFADDEADARRKVEAEYRGLRQPGKIAGIVEVVDSFRENQAIIREEMRRSLR